MILLVEQHQLCEDDFPCPGLPCFPRQSTAALGVSDRCCPTYRLSEDVLRCIYKQLVQERVKHGGDVKRKLRTITSRCAAPLFACCMSSLVSLRTRLRTRSIP